MPYPFAVGSVFTLTVVGKQNGQTTLNVLHYVARDDATTSDYEGFCAALDDDFTRVNGFRDKWLAAAGGEWEMTSAVWQAIYPTRLVKQAFAYTGKVGTYNEACYTQNLSAVIDKRSQYATRWGRGSVHIPGVPQATDAGGVWDVDYIQVLAELAGKMKIDVSADLAPGVSPILWSPATPTRKTPVLDCDPMTTIRVMRRRTVGVGV